MSARRLLAGVGAHPMTYEQHREVHREPIRWHGADLRDELMASGLRGRGGAGFPLAGKLDAVARRRRRPVLVANGCEGEPMSATDRVLLQSAPHLVIDGACAIGGAIDADEVLLAVDELDIRSTQSLHDALRERPERHDGRHIVEVVAAPSGYVTGQETALVNWRNRGDAVPTVAPPRVTERGVAGRPTLVSNVETLAHAGLIARHGARWFRETGTSQDPGTALITLSGAVVSPGVYEIEHGLALVALLREAGGRCERIAAVLIGGYAGGWLTPEEARTVKLESDDLRRVGTRLGGGIVVALPASACPVTETARVADWMAAQSSGQCGPCVHGLASIAAALADVRGGHDGRRALADLARWSSQIPGRGACGHPDGAVSMVASALRVFRADFLDHAEHGPCDACENEVVLEVPERVPAAR